MSIILIRDLPDSVDLDSQAMAAISGGSRLQGRQIPPGASLLRSDRLIDYPGGVVRARLAQPSGKRRTK